MLPGIILFFLAQPQKPRTSLFSQYIICSSRKTLFPFEQLTHCPSLTVKIIFITTYSTKIDHFGCSVLGAVALRSRKEQVTNLQAELSITTCLTFLVFDNRTNLQGQYLIYKTMQHYRISAQRTNSLNRHHQVVNKCKKNLGPAKYILRCLSLKNIFLFKPHAVMKLLRSQALPVVTITEV